MKQAGSFFVVMMLVSMLMAPTLYAQSDELVAQQFRAKGLQFQQQGDHKKALFYYTRASVLDTHNPAVFNDMGLTQEHLGNFSEAERNYRQALEVDRKYLPAIANLGYLYSKQGQNTLALQYLKERVNYGSADDQWTQAAEEEIERIYQRVPQLNQARLKAQAQELEIQLSESKIRFQEKMARSKSVDFEAAYQNGLKALDERRYGDAVTALENALAVDPRNAQARHALRRAKFEMEKSAFEEDAAVVRGQMKDQTLRDFGFVVTPKTYPAKKAEAIPSNNHSLSSVGGSVVQVAVKPVDRDKAVNAALHDEFVKGSDSSSAL